jgi:hypothetical protein
VDREHSKGEQDQRRGHPPPGRPRLLAPSDISAGAGRDAKGRRGRLSPQGGLAPGEGQKQELDDPRLREVAQELVALQRHRGHQAGQAVEGHRTVRQRADPVSPGAALHLRARRPPKEGLLRADGLRGRETGSAGQQGRERRPKGSPTCPR